MVQSATARLNELIQLGQPIQSAHDFYDTNPSKASVQFFKSYKKAPLVPGCHGQIKTNFMRQRHCLKEN